MEIIAHTMQLVTNNLPISPLDLRNYQDKDYKAYKQVYENCFSEMRQALKLFPVNCCNSREKLKEKAADIFILETDGELIGSVAIYGSEIDDLIVARKYQGKGHGQRLLRFAIARMQRLGICPIVLHVADWNKKAMRLYEKNGFVVVKTEIV